MNPLAMSKEEREAFLAGVHVAVLTVTRPGKGPLAVPVWYAYEPGGDVRFVTADSAPKSKLIRAAGRVSLCVQTESVPYKYLTVEGPTTIEKPDFERDVRAIAYRYLGREMGERYIVSTEEARRTSPEILVRIRPEGWRSEDFSKWSM